MIYTAIVAIILIAASAIYFNGLSIRLFLLSPPVLLNSFILIYAVIGFYLFWGGNYNFLGIDFSSTLDDTYFVISTFTIVFSVAFFILFKLKIKNNLSATQIEYKANGKFLLGYTIPLFAYSLLRINEITIPVVNNLLSIFFNSLVVVLGYSLVNNARWSVITSGAFISVSLYLGFRYRLVLFFLPIIFYIFNKEKITAFKLTRAISVVIFCLSLMAIAGVAREYSSGLQLDRLKDLSIYQIIINGLFNDTSTVMLTGAFIDYVDHYQKFAYLNQIYYALIYFVPSSLYADKMYSPIFEYLSILSYQINNESGLAVMAFAEYYHTAGYIGVVVFGLLFSYVFAILFKKAVATKGPYFFYAYFSIMAWYINSLTRGYFPQNIQDLASVVIGLYIIKKKFSKPISGSV